jgi:assimilatory nitrate reductase catalytic subunit
VPPESIERAAQLFAKAGRAVVLHARGVEHQSKGVENCLALINLCLATGNIGREGAGCAMITGQGNGQGGREHGQKCDQLPGQRSISDLEARAHTAKVWGVSPEEIPQAGYSAVEIMEAIHRGEIRALLSACFNPLVSLPDAALIAILLIVQVWLLSATLEAFLAGHTGPVLPPRFFRVAVFRVFCPQHIY